MDGKGIHLTVWMLDKERLSSEDVELAVLPCDSRNISGEKVGIYLRAVPGSGEIFERYRAQSSSVSASRSLTSLAARPKCDASDSVATHMHTRLNHRW